MSSLIASANSLLSKAPDFFGAIHIIDLPGKKIIATSLYI